MTATIAAAAHTPITTATQDPTITLPASSSGELLVVIFSATATHGDPTVPSGWTFLTDAERPAGDTRSGDRDQIMAKVADGSEGTSLQIDTSTTAVKGHALALRITGAHASTLPACTPSTGANVGTSAAPDSPSLSPSGGSADYLWLTLALQEGEGGTPASQPTNYTSSASLKGDTGTGGATATNAIMAVAYRALTAATEDPPAWSFPGSEDWVAYTLAVYPAATGEQHSGSATLTGGGVISGSGSKGATGAGGTVTAGGVVVAPGTTDRGATSQITAGGVLGVSTTGAHASAATLTAGGVLVIADQGSGIEEHSGTMALTAGGVLSTSVSAARFGASLLSAGGVLAVADVQDRIGIETLTGAGVLTLLQSSGHFVTVTLTGGGQLSIAGGQDVALTDLGAVMEGIADALTAADVTERAYGYPAETIDAPCAVVGFPDRIDFDLTYQRGADRADIPIYFLVGRVSTRSARDKLASIITGATGVKDTLDGNLGGLVQSLRVTEMRVVNVQIAGIDYLAAHFNAEVVK